LLNSLNSFALDEAALHIPVRAVENGVFVVAANKVGPLLPVDQVEMFSQALGIPPQVLQGAGESQIVAPDGEVLASASRTEEELIVADIDLAEVRPLNDRFGHRRPEIYGPLAKPHSAVPRDDVPESIVVRCVRSQMSDAVEAQLVVLPEGTAPPASIPTGCGWPPPRWLTSDTSDSYGPATGCATNKRSFITPTGSTRPNSATNSHSAKHRWATSPSSLATITYTLRLSVWPLSRAPT
jgi:hypothetical protein